MLRFYTSRCCSRNESHRAPSRSHCPRRPNSILLRALTSLKDVLVVNPQGPQLQSKDKVVFAWCRWIAHEISLPNAGTFWVPAFGLLVGSLVTVQRPAAPYIYMHIHYPTDSR
jgi:hypothetical protein